MVARDDRGERSKAPLVWPASRWAALLYVTGMVVRIAGLPHRSLWIDEFVSIEWARLPLTQISGVAIAAHSPPLYFILLALALALGPPIAASRALSLLISMALLPVLHRVGRALLGERGGLVLLALAAVSPFLAEVTMEVRTYGLLALGGAIAVLGLLEWREGRGPALAIAGVLLAAYTHHLGLFAVAVIDLSWLLLGGLSSERRRSWITGQVVLLALLAPAIYWPLANYGHFPFVQYTWMQAFKRYAGVPIHWTEGYLVSQVSAATLLSRAGDPATLAALAVGLGVPLWVASVSLRREALATPAVRLGLAWAIVPIALASCLAGSREYISARYAVMAAPGYYLLLAAALNRARAVWERALAVAFGLTLIAGVAVLERSPVHTHYPEDWRRLATTLADRARPGDALVTTERAALGLGLYWGDRAPAVVATVAAPESAGTPPGGLAGLAGPTGLAGPAGLAGRAGRAGSPDSAASPGFAASPGSADSAGPRGPDGPTARGISAIPLTLVLPPYPVALPSGRTWVLIGNRQLPEIGGIALRPDALDAGNLALLDRAMATAWGRRRRGEPEVFGEALWLVDYSR